MKHRDPDPRDSGHREAWAAELDELLPARSTAPLPEGLAARLRNIPRDVDVPSVGCDDVERLYRAALASAHGDVGDPAVDAHLESCRRCRLLVGTLESALRVVRLPLPRALRGRLQRLAEARRRPPRWARDGSFAVAASIVLSASLVLLSGGRPVELAKVALDRLSVNATVLAERGSEGGSEVWETVADAVGTRVERSREGLAERAGNTREWIGGVIELYEEKHPRLPWRPFGKQRLNTQGEDHDG